MFKTYRNKIIPDSFETSVYNYNIKWPLDYTYIGKDIRLPLSNN